MTFISHQTGRNTGAPRHMFEPQIVTNIITIITLSMNLLCMILYLVKKKIYFIVSKKILRRVLRIFPKYYVYYNFSLYYCVCGSIFNIKSVYNIICICARIPNICRSAIEKACEMTTSCDGVWLRLMQYI